MVFFLVFNDRCYLFPNFVWFIYVNVFFLCESNLFIYKKILFILVQFCFLQTCIIYLNFIFYDECKLIDFISFYTFC